MPDVRLIDANALLQTLSDMCCSDNNVKTRQIVDSTLHDLMPQIIRDEPTVDAQPVKRGKWRERMSTPYSVKCCLCGYASVQESSYCGGCGAFMRGDNDVG